MSRRYNGLTCKACGGHVADVGKLSWRGKCRQCAIRLSVENTLGLYYHVGPPLERWRHGVAASVGATIPEKPAPEPPPE